MQKSIEDNEPLDPEYIFNENLNKYLEANRESPNKYSLKAHLCLIMDIAKAIEDHHNRNGAYQILTPQYILLENSPSPSCQPEMMLHPILTPINSENQSNTETNSTNQSIQYASPEQRMGGEIDHRTDIYTLGVILFQLVKGGLPERPGVFDLADIPTDVANIIRKATAPSPNDRYQTAVAMVEDLQKVVDNLSVQEEAPTELNVSTPEIILRPNDPIADCDRLLVAHPGGASARYNLAQDRVTIGSEENLNKIVLPDVAETNLRLDWHETEWQITLLDNAIDAHLNETPLIQGKSEPWLPEQRLFLGRYTLQIEMVAVQENAAESTIAEAPELLRLSLHHGRNQAKPGQRIDTTLDLYHLQEVTAWFKLSIKGKTAEWISLLQNSIRFDPEETKSIPITIVVPDDAMAGAQSFVIEAISESDNTIAATYPGQILVETVTNIHLELVQKQLYTREQCQLWIYNNGNKEDAFIITIEDEKGNVALHKPVQLISIKPGQKKDVILTPVIQHQQPQESHDQYDFSIKATSSTGYVKIIEATLLNAPPNIQTYGPIELSVNPHQIKLCGGEQAEAKLNLFNTGDKEYFIDLKIDIKHDDVQADWVKLSRDSLWLKPSVMDVVSIYFRPLAGSRSWAGKYRFRVMIHCPGITPLWAEEEVNNRHIKVPQSPAARVTYEITEFFANFRNKKLYEETVGGQIVIEPERDFTAKLLTAQIISHRACQILVHNKGNVFEDITVEPFDESGDLRFRCRSERINLKPGDSKRLKIFVMPKRWSREARNRPFQLTVSAPDRDPIQLDGRVTIPRPIWLKKPFLLLVWAALLVLLFQLARCGSSAPPVTQTAIPVVTTTSTPLLQLPIMTPTVTIESPKPSIPETWSLYESGDGYMQNANKVVFRCGPGCLIGWGIENVNYIVRLTNGRTENQATEALSPFCASGKAAQFCGEIPQNWDTITATVQLSDGSQQVIEWHYSQEPERLINLRDVEGIDLVRYPYPEKPTSQQEAFICGTGCLIGWGIETVKFKLHLSNGSAPIPITKQFVNGQPFCAVEDNIGCTLPPDNVTKIDIEVSFISGDIYQITQLPDLSLSLSRNP